MKKKINNIFKDIPKEILHKRILQEQPDFVSPMLATLTDKYFSSKDWFYEHKFDGVRCVAYKKNGKVTLLSRNDNNMNQSYPEIVTALEQQKADNFIIDGEIIAREEGVSSFQMLQSRIGLRTISKHIQTSVPIYFCIFDIIYAQNYKLTHLPLYIRKNILKKLLDYSKVLIYTTHRVGNGVEYYHQACKKRWEGLIAKDKNGIYVSKRSRLWLKFKCSSGQELVIGGYTTPTGSRINFGALLVGYYENGEFKYAGKVGTGYSHQTLEILGEKLKKLETSKCPFVNFDQSKRNVHWVKPKLVGEFEFAQWTKDNKLRVGRFKGLRNDKKAKDVIKEVAKHISNKK